MLHNFPLWTPMPLRIKSFVPGIDWKKRMPQIGLLQTMLAHINILYLATTYVDTDGLATPEYSSSEICFIS